MRRVTSHSEYIDDYTRQPIPFARSEYLLYNVKDEHNRYGSIVEQQGVIENQSSMLIKQHYPKENINVSNEVDDDFTASWITITFMSQSMAQPSAPPPSSEPAAPLVEAVIDLPQPKPESGDPAAMRSRAKDKKVKDRKKRSKKSKKGRKSKKEKSLPKIRKGSKKSEKSKKRESSTSKKKRTKDKARAKSRKKKLSSSPKRIPSEGKKRKHWIEEEFLQQGGIQGGKLEPKKESEVQEKKKKKSDEPTLPVMDTQQGTSESKEKKKSDEKTGAVAPESPGPLPPMPPPPVDDYFRIKPAEGDKRRTDLERLRDKIYGIKPERPPERVKTSPPLQRTQDDESASKPKLSSQKESVSISVTGLPLPIKVSAKKRETPELPAVGDRFRVNIDEILRLGAIMERRSMSTAKKASFEWIALNRTTIKEQPEAFSSHLLSAVGDVRLEKSLACDALNVLMYQHTVTPDEYLRLCQHLETVQTITIGILAQLLRTNTQYYSSIGSQRLDALNVDVYR